MAYWAKAKLDRTEVLVSLNEAIGENHPARLLNDILRGMDWTDWEITLEKLQQADATRKKDGIDPKKNPAQLPKADTDSKLMPNKEGGYGPNHTPTAVTDGTAGFIVDCNVLDGPDEQNELLPSRERIRENYGEYPEKASADKAFGTGLNLEGMESRGIDFHTPVESPTRRWSRRRLRRAIRPGVTIHVSRDG